MSKRDIFVVATTLIVTAFVYNFFDNKYTTPAYAQQLQTATTAQAWIGDVSISRKIRVTGNVVQIQVRNLDSADAMQISFDDKTSWWTIPSGGSNGNVFTIATNEVWMRQHPSASNPATVEIMFLKN